MQRLMRQPVINLHGAAIKHEGIMQATGRTEWLRSRATDLSIKFLTRRQHGRLAARHYPRLAVVPSEHVGLAITAGGLYEPDEIALIQRIAAATGLQNSVMLDIGANIGNHACALAPSFARVLAFEPNPPVAALLRANALINGLSNITVHEVGLADHDAELSFGIAEAGNDGSGSFAEGKGGKTLPVRHGDTYLAAHARDLHPAGLRIGFIKCDVQGFERDVFAGLAQTLAAHRPLVMFESENRRDGEASWAVLAKAGYTNLARIRAPGDDQSKLAREWARFRHGTGCWLEPVTTIPDRHCNLIVSVEAVRVG
jgi:FkbM family methyltransferase